MGLLATNLESSNFNDSDPLILSALLVRQTIDEHRRSSG